MFQEIKKFLYFPFAGYFKFFAKIQLKIWKPRVFVITGSSGKTTLLHLIESQIRENARFSHKANSAFGIPFDILGLKRTTLKPEEWIYLFLLAPFKAFKKPFGEKLYFVEADCDRPGEGKFLADLLKPEVCLWLNVSRSHSVNFEKLVEKSEFDTVEELIAYEFGYFLESTAKLAIINADSMLINGELKRSSCPIIKASKKELQVYGIFQDHTEFKINNELIKLPFLLPEDTFYDIYMCFSLLNYLNIEPDLKFSGFEMPPGRSSIFKGIKNTLIVDSSYNANLSSMTAMLSMFNSITSAKKWAVLSDMTEQGRFEKSEHEKLADVISDCDFERIILMGPRMEKYVYPVLKSKIKQKTVLGIFLTPTQVLDYLEKNLEGGEVILFKGARFLEGVIEQILANKDDSKKLCRREAIWHKRRKEWGL